MDDHAFDRLTYTLHARLDRRVVGGSLLGGIATALGLAVATPDVAEARSKKKKPKPKKCKQPNMKCGKKGCCTPGQDCCNGKCCAEGLLCTSRVCGMPGTCTFTVDGLNWGLIDNCELTAALVLPKNVNLDGRGKTITLTGPAENFGSGVIVQPESSGPATLERLTISASGMTACGGRPPSVVNWRRGTVQNVTIRDIACADNATIADLGETDAENVIILAPTASQNSTGILFSGPGSATDCSVDNAWLGIGSQAPAGAVFGTNTLTNVVQGVVLLGTAGRATLVGNVIQGRGAIDPGASLTAGVIVAEGAGASIGGNYISNFKSTATDPPFNVGCGILISPDAGRVIRGGNDFPNPPGNNQDVCFA